MVEQGNTSTISHFDILPDVVTTAKGLGNGVPIGACLASGKAATTLEPGNHGSTYGGNPLVCAAAQAVVDTITEEGLYENANQTGSHMLKTLRAELADQTLIKDIRGTGLMIGIELHAPCAELVDKAREHGVLINVTAGNVIRLLPPLILNRQQADVITSTVVACVSELADQLAADNPQLSSAS